MARAASGHSCRCLRRRGPGASAMAAAARRRHAAGRRRWRAAFWPCGWSRRRCRIGGASPASRLRREALPIVRCRPGVGSRSPASGLPRILDAIASLLHRHPSPGRRSDQCRHVRVMGLTRSDSAAPRLSRSLRMPAARMAPTSSSRSAAVMISGEMALGDEIGLCIAVLRAGGLARIALAVTAVKPNDGWRWPLQNFPEREIHISSASQVNKHFPIGKVPLHSVGGRVRIS